MYMKKNSPHLEFVAYTLTKIVETGIKNSLIRRYINSEPDCKPLRTKGTSLGMQFFISLFVSYFCVCILCLFIFILEIVFKPNRYKIISDQLSDRIDHFSHMTHHQNIHELLKRKKLILLLVSHIIHHQDIHELFESRKGVLLLEKLHKLEQILHYNCPSPPSPFHLPPTNQLPTPNKSPPSNSSKDKSGN